MKDKAGDIVCFYFQQIKRKDQNLQCCSLTLGLTYLLILLCCLKHSQPTTKSLKTALKVILSFKKKQLNNFLKQLDPFVFRKSCLNESKWCICLRLLSAVDEHIWCTSAYLHGVKMNYSVHVDHEGTCHPVQQCTTFFFFLNIIFG